MEFILFNGFFGAVALIGLIILWFVLPPDSPWTPWWQVPIPKIREGLRSAKVTKKDIVYDLGSGDGRIPITAAKYFGAKGVGIEFDYIRHLIGWLRVRLLDLEKRVKLRRGNFFNYNISDATVIFIYLVPRVLEKLEPKLLSELKKGTRIISYKYKFKSSKKTRIKFIRSDLKNQIHLYKIT